MRRGPGRPAGAQTGASRDALLAAARALLAEKGLPGLTLREVARRADVQPALVNYYFGGKDGLLREVIARVAAEMLERIERAVAQGGDAEERVRALVHGVAEALATDPYAPRLIMEQVLFADDEQTDAFVESYARPNLAAIQSLLEDGKRSGRLRMPELRFFVPAFMGSILFFFLSAPVLRRLFGVREFTPELTAAFAESAADLLLDGLAVRDTPSTPHAPAQERSSA